MRPEARAYFWWLLQSSQLTRPRLQPLYRLDGGPHAAERTLAMDGYRGSRPVRVGNAAACQRQLDTYEELLQTAWLYAEAGELSDADIGRRLAATADLVCRLWREPDAGIWEVRGALPAGDQGQGPLPDRAGRVSSTGQRNTSMTEVLRERWRAACDSGRGAA
ncbi:MAG TPA: glycoside hydrolase family 15 protein [Streptosporangiaceae bacterium]|nr:glycoside hydrolase family 15 protein [Streptosporangiaceae bacterium]